MKRLITIFILLLGSIFIELFLLVNLQFVETSKTLHKVRKSNMDQAIPKKTIEQLIEENKDQKKGVIQKSELVVVLKGKITKLTISKENSKAYFSLRQDNNESSFYLSTQALRQLKVYKNKQGKTSQISLSQLRRNDSIKIIYKLDFFKLLVANPDLSIISIVIYKLN